MPSVRIKRIVRPKTYYSRRRNLTDSNGCCCNCCSGQDDGGDSGGDGIENDCCSEFSLPETIHLTISPGGGSCSCVVEQEIDLTYSGINERWSATGVTVNSCGFSFSNISLLCSEGVFQLQWSAGCPGSSGGTTLEKTCEADSFMASGCSAFSAFCCSPSGGTICFNAFAP